MIQKVRRSFLKQELSLNHKVMICLAHHSSKQQE